MKTFEQPLTASEESKYLADLRGDNPESAKEAKRILIERNMRLVAHIARKYQNPEEHSEDLISVGTIGLIKAIDSYDASKGSKLVTYASKCIENELLMLMRTRKKLLREVSLFEPIGTDKEGNEINLLDICESVQEDVVERLTLGNHINKLGEIIQGSLSQREQVIIALRYGLWTGEEMTQREVGEQLQISRSYVSRIEKKALNLLREQMK